MKWLTKSDYMKWLIHPAYLWLAKFDKDKLPPISEADQVRFDDGYEVQAWAQKLWPDGIAIETVLMDGVRDSERAMATQRTADQPVALFEASVLTKRRLYARADVLIWRPVEACWDLYEIKSSTSVKETHRQDLAFQKLAFEEAGHAIGRTFVVHVNGQYSRGEGKPAPDYLSPINPRKLFKVGEVTDSVNDLAHITAENVGTALGVLAQPDRMPNDGVHLSGNMYAWRDIYRRLHPELAVDSVLNLTRLSLAQFKWLHERDITSIRQIPLSANKGLRLMPKQRTQVEVELVGRPNIHAAKIATELAGLTYPLYFLDYETFAGAVPLWDGVRPYQQIPFQYSLHILNQPGGTLRHAEYLAEGTGYPVKKLLTKMNEDIGPTGSVIVWNQSFEMGCNDAMGYLHPEFADFLKGVNARVYDLMEVFGHTWYTHPDFHGSVSIKKVMPVLVPDLSYKNLGIGEGLTAQIRWMKAARGQATPEEARQTYDYLIEYCGQDTLAMVRIYEVLRQTVQAIPGQTEPGEKA